MLCSMRLVLDEGSVQPTSNDNIENKFGNFWVCFQCGDTWSMSVNTLAMLEHGSVDIFCEKVPRIWAKSVGMIKGKAVHYLFCIWDEEGLGTAGIFLPEKRVGKVIYISKITHRTIFFKVQAQGISLSLISIYL